MTTFRGHEDLPRRTTDKTKPGTEMTLACACGKTYRVAADKLSAGASVTCRACGRKISNPGASSIAFGSVAGTDADVNKSASVTVPVRPEGRPAPPRLPPKMAVQKVPEPKPIPKARRLVPASRTSYKAVLVAPIVLATFAAVAVYFHSVPEDLKSVKAVIVPKNAKPAKQVADAGQAGNRANMKFGFDINDIAKTNAWAFKFADSLQTVGDPRELSKVTDQLDKIKPDFDALKGQTVRWQLSVKSVSEFSVELDGEFNGLILSAVRSDGETVLSEFNLLAAATTGEKVIHLTIGEHISREDAAKLQVGDKLPIMASVDKVHVGSRLLVPMKDPNKSVIGFVLTVTLIDVVTPAVYESAHQPPIQLSIAELQAAFTNELMGKKLYAGKRIQVTGFPGVSLSGDVLRDPNNNDIYIKCGYDKYLFSEIAEARGSKTPFLLLTVVGICQDNGFLGSCKLVTTYEEVLAQIEKHEEAEHDAKDLQAEALEDDVRKTPAITSAGRWVVGQVREIEGQVSKVNSPNSDGTILLYLSFEGTAERLSCLFRPKYQDQLAALKGGTVIRVKGKYVSYGRLDGCIFLK